MDSGLTQFTFFRGRVALYAILKTIEIGQADGVATQAFTCVAVPEAIMATGAQPLWIDIEPEGFNMDPEDLNRKLTSQTKAIIAQHTYGIPANMDAILAVADQHGLPVIEDCCHTFVSSYKGRRVGYFGTASFYSFEWGKPIVAGIGGSALPNDPNLEQRLRQSYSGYKGPGLVKRLKIEMQYRAFRVLYRPILYWPVRSLFHRLGSIGVAESNYNPVGQGQIAEDFFLRMSEAVRKRLCKKVQDIDTVTAHSRSVTQQYRSRINSSVVQHPVLPRGTDVVFARYPLLTENKDQLLDAARKVNIELAEWYSTPVHRLSGDDLAHVHYTPGTCPTAELRCKQVVSLPTYPAVTHQDIDRTIRFLNGVSLDD